VERLAGGQNADCVYVIERGRVEEFGTHDELLRRNGLYKRLVLRQLQSVDSGAGVVAGSSSGEA